jgi:hypothetical protein
LAASPSRPSAAPLAAGAGAGVSEAALTVELVARVALGLGLLGVLVLLRVAMTGRIVAALTEGAEGCEGELVEDTVETENDTDEVAVVETGADEDGADETGPVKTGPEKTGSDEGGGVP